MTDLLYSDLENKYFLLDYSPSHSELLIRSVNKSDSMNIYNVDLFFKAVYNIQLPTQFEGISVTKKDRHQENISFPNIANRTDIFELVDRDGNIGFIDASVFVVFHNKLDILTSSLGDFTWTKENKEIFSRVIQ